MTMAKQLTDWTRYQPLVDARAELDRLEAEGAALVAEKQQPSAFEENKAAKEQAAATIRKQEKSARMEAGKIVEVRYKGAVAKMITAMLAAAEANAEVRTIYLELAAIRGAGAKLYFWDDLRPPVRGLGDYQSRLSAWLKAAKEYTDG